MEWPRADVWKCGAIQEERREREKWRCLRRKRPCSLPCCTVLKVACVFVKAYHNGTGELPLYRASPRDGTQLISLRGKHSHRLGHLVNPAFSTFTISLCTAQWHHVRSRSVEVSPTSISGVQFSFCKADTLGWGCSSTGDMWELLHSILIIPQARQDGTGLLSQHRGDRVRRIKSLGSPWAMWDSEAVTPLNNSPPEPPGKPPCNFHVCPFVSGSFCGEEYLQVPSIL